MLKSYIFYGFWIASFLLLSVLLINGNGNINSYSNGQLVKSPTATETIESPKPQSNPQPPRYERVLISYVYYETEDAKQNLDFFLRHALHNKTGTDFLFVINSKNLSVTIPDLPNVRVIRRSNTCFDLGTHKEVIQSLDRSKYDKFILMNASVRGPFLATYAPQCWSDIFTSKVTDKVKLVGTTTNCKPRPHLQSMLLATDNIGLDVLFKRLQCFRDLPDAIWAGEIWLTRDIIRAGYSVDALATSKYNQDDYFRTCTHGDPYYSAFETPLHPQEVVFIKAKLMPKEMMKVHSHFLDRIQFSSFDHCK